MHRPNGHETIGAELIREASLAALTRSFAALARRRALEEAERAGWPLPSSIAEELSRRAERRLGNPEG